MGVNLSLIFPSTGKRRVCAPVNFSHNCLALDIYVRMPLLSVYSISMNVGEMKDEQKETTKGLGFEEYLKLSGQR